MGTHAGPSTAENAPGNAGGIRGGASERSLPVPRPFPHSARILRSAEFRIIYDHGTRLSGPLFAAFCHARPPAGDVSHPPTGPRLGLTVPRAVGKAVIRNRIKRRLREVFRLHRHQLGARWDIVINPRRTAADAPFAKLEEAFRKVIEKCGP